MSFELPLGRLKKATINEFKGKKLLDLRNYYEKDGEEKPTQKGISLTAEQWQALLARKDEISRLLGIEVFDESNSVQISDKKKKRSRDAAEHAEKVPKEPKHAEEALRQERAKRVKSEEFVSPEDKEGDA